MRVHPPLGNAALPKSACPSRDAGHCQRYVGHIIDEGCQPLLQPRSSPSHVFSHCLNQRVAVLQPPAGPHSRHTGICCSATAGDDCSTLQELRTGQTL